MQSDDFDLDALLDAQSSDDEDVDLLELERSLDEILNDADPGDDASGSHFSPKKADEKPSGMNGSRHSQDFVVEREDEHSSVEDLDAKSRELDIDVESRSDDSEATEAAGIVSVSTTGSFFKQSSSELRDGNLPLGEYSPTSPQSVGLPATELIRNSAGLELRRTYGPLKEETDQSRVLDHAEASGYAVAGAKSSRVWEGVSNVMSGASSSGNPIPLLSSPSGLPIGNRVSQRPGAALALAAAASRQVARGTSIISQKSSLLESANSKQHLEIARDLSSDEVEISPPAAVARTSSDTSLPSQAGTNLLGSQSGMTESDSIGIQITGEGKLGFPYVVLVQDKLSSSEDSSATDVLEDWKSRMTTSLTAVEQSADGSGFSSDNQLQAMPSFSDALASQEEHISDTNLQQEAALSSLVDSCEGIQDQEEEESNVQQLHNLIGDIDESHTSSPDGTTSSSNKAFDSDSGMDDPNLDRNNEEAASSINASDEESSDSNSVSMSRVAQRSNPFEKSEVVDAMQNTHVPEIETQEVEEEVKEEPVHRLTTFELAEELEKRTATSGLHWEEGAAAQPMRLEGIQRGPPAIGLLQLDSAGTLSHALASPAMRRDHGTPQALAVHANFIAVGLSKGAVLVTPSKYSATRSADEMDAKKAFLLGGVTDKMGAAVSSLCFNQQGDLLLVGYANGTICLWDVAKGSVAKVIVGEHTVAIVHTLFLGQDAPAARYLRAISGDCKGLVLLHTFSQQLVPLLRRFSVTTQCLLDGQRTGIVLSVSPLLPDEGFQVQGGMNSAQQGGAAPPPTLGSVMGGVMGGVVGGVGAMDVGRKFLYDGATSADEGAGGMVVFVTHTTVLVVRLVPALEVCSRMTRPAGIRDGAIPYTAWRRIRAKLGSSGSMALSNGSSDPPSVSNGKVPNGHVMDGGHPKEEETDLAKDSRDDDDLPVLAMAWDRKMLIAQLTKSELRKVREWELDSPAVGLAWLEEQMLVVVTAKDQLCLFTKEGVEVERASLGGEQEGIGALIYHTQMTNSLGNPEKAHHSSLSVRGAALYLLGPLQLWRARLLPWRDRIKALQDAGDWMGAFHIAMELYDGRARGVTGLPRGLDAMREAIMSTLLALLSAYIDEAFAYLSLAFGSASLPPPPSGAKTGAEMEATSDAVESLGVMGMGQDLQEAREQYARVGGVAIEFCVHVGKQEVLFENVFSKFEAVGQRGTFLELLEPYILKDMLGGLAPEVMQALVEHYSRHGWLERVEQCVLHMDIASLDFNQVVKLCREHGLYSALIYLFNKGLDDFRSPLEELLTVADQAPVPSQAQLVGYKLLVYLKYCFCGLAFPPGHGSLPAARLPALRGEILQFLLDQQGPARKRFQMSSNFEDARVYPRLSYILHLDMQATLLVLRLAFPINGPLGIGKYGRAYLPAVNDEDLVAVTSEDVDDGVRYVQAVVNALIEILNAPQRGVAEKFEDTQKTWPANEDVGGLLDFVAQFVASGHAVVSGSTFMRILEYLASSSPGSKNAREREDLMVRLLNTVPDSSLDASRTLLLAQGSNFWQVSALLRTRGGDYEAALDDYLSDKTRLPQPFVFIMQILDNKNGPKGSVPTKFRNAVLARIPQLMQHSIKGTLWIVLAHLSSDNQRVIKELASHPKLLFAYLKGIMDVRSGSHPLPFIGSENLITSSSHVVNSGKSRSSGEQPEMSSFSKVEGSQQWEPDVDLGDLLQRSDVEVTDEMAELYVQLLCQFEPRSVLKFLESYENYRLEHCLKLCQEYGITDAAIFLLERVGDVASALALVLADLDTRRHALELSISTLSSTAAQAPHKDDKWLMNFPEVAAVKSAVAVAMALCQRNTQRLEPQESISLWFRLLDRIVEPSGDFTVGDSNGESNNGTSCSRQESGNSRRSRGTRGRSAAQQKVAVQHTKGKLVRKVLVSIMGDIIDGMMGYVPLHFIMEKILADHGSHPFGDFRPTILNMLSAYGYERAILRTAKQLIEDDTFYNINSLRRGCSHGYAALASSCCICGLGLDDNENQRHMRRALGARSSSGEKLKGKALDRGSGTAEVVTLRGSNSFSIFYCGHAAHNTCLGGNGSSKEDAEVSGCPVCSLKVKSSSLSSLVKRAVVKGADTEAQVGNSRPGPSTATYLRGSAIKSNHSNDGASRLEVLKQLQQGKSLLELGPSLELCLAPPRKPRPRSAAVPDSSSTSRSRPAQRTLLGTRR